MATKKITNKKSREVLAKQMQDKIDEINKELNYPIVTKGSHLTVTTHADGRTELEWDDEALQRDVAEALAQYESKTGKVAESYEFDWR